MTTNIQMVDPLRLHQHWSFLLRGLQDIQRKARGHTRWWLEDVYASILYKAATAYTVTVGVRPVGWFCLYPQVIPFTGETELFLWIMWSAPLRETVGLDMDAVTMDTLRFICSLAIQQGHVAVATLTVRKGLMRKYADVWTRRVESVMIERPTMEHLVNGAMLH